LKGISPPGTRVVFDISAVAVAAGVVAKMSSKLNIYPLSSSAFRHRNEIMASIFNTLIHHARDCVASLQKDLPVEMDAICILRIQLEYLVTAN